MRLEAKQPPPPVLEGVIRSMIYPEQNPFFTTGMSPKLCLGSMIRIDLSGYFTRFDYRYSRNSINTNVV